MTVARFNKNDISRHANRRVELKSSERKLRDDVAKNNRLLWTAASMSIVVFASCGTNADPDPSTGTAPETSRVEIPEEMSGVAELPEAEQDAALEQKICPVSDEPIGSMGKPIKVPVEGQDVYVCCEGCVDMVKENPEKYLTKLKQE